MFVHACLNACKNLPSSFYSTIYVSFSKEETDLSLCSQDPGLPSKGRGTLAEWLCCRVRAGPEISKQSKAVTQPSESFQSQNHLRTITFRFSADVYNRALRTTHRHIPKGVSHSRRGLSSEHSWTQNLKLSYSCGSRKINFYINKNWTCSK